MLHVRLFCGAGMSTSLLARKMQNYADEKGVDVLVDARPVSGIKQSSIEQLKELDCALLGPQVAFEIGQFKPKFEQAGVPFAVIPMQDYGMVRGDKVMQMALDMIEEAKT
ncbi:MAG: PTS sugar transporter subunit IIB [Coriobacteriales bacterium]|nr:PTS sugar transporter subunit IIB [Coriobacteriales bacterium]